MSSLLPPPPVPPHSPGESQRTSAPPAVLRAHLLREARARHRRIHVSYAHSQRIYVPRQHIYAMRENTCMLCTQLTADTCYTRLSPTHAACVLAMIYTLLSRAAGAPTTHARSVRMTKSCDNLTGLRAQGADSHLRAALPAGPAASGAAFKLGTRHGTRHGASWWQVQHAGAWRTWRERERERERSHSPGITLAFVKNEVNKREKKRRHLSRVITPLAMG